MVMVPVEHGEGELAGDEKQTGETVVQAGEDFREKYIRAAADLENQRKRFTREKQRLLKQGRMKSLSGFLDVVDSLERALGSGGEISDEGTEAWRSGVDGIYRQMMEVLQKQDVRPFESVGRVFDPERHEAVGRVPSEVVGEGVVLEEMQKGYLFENQEVLRPARVVVAMAPDGESNA